MKRLLPVLGLAVGLASARNLKSQGSGGGYVPFGIIDAAAYVMDKGDLWNTMWNRGEHGDAPNEIRPSYSWPGSAPGVNVYYLWQGKFWVGAIVGGDTYVTQTEYYEWEWGPSDENTNQGFHYIGPGQSALDVEAIYHDFTDNDNNSGGRHLGIKVIERALSWPHDPYNSLFGYVVGITYNKDENDCGSPDTLENVYVAWVYDADVCGADPTDPHIDDLVMFDGYTFGELDTLQYQGGAEDTLCVLADTTLSGSDGIPDGYIIWGDDPEEKEITKEWADQHNGGVMPDSSFYIRPDNGDTVWYYYLIPHNLSYIWDSDNPSEPGDDTGEDGKCAGYIGMAAIYTSPSPNDSTDPSDPTFRIVRTAAHQWWNWESDPPDDISRYKYLAGHHDATAYYRFAPHPYDLGAKEFDYRFVNSYGPFKIANGDTIWLVWIGAVGMGLNGGPDNVYRGGKYMLGLRQLVEYGLRAYYTGSGCDPAHPCGPTEAPHWKIPIPPPSPFLTYTANPDGIRLIWDNRAELTPDPVTGQFDFAGYAVYRDIYAPQFLDKPLAVFFKPGLPDTVKEKIKEQLWPQWKDEITYYDSLAHEFEDPEPKPGFPYYYAVTAFDWDVEKQLSLESAKDNYKKQEGAPTPVNMITRSSGDDWKERVRVVPNPFLGSAVWSATEVLNKIEFQNLPPSCRIDIYTLSGDHIVTLNHRSATVGGDATSGSGTETWDLLTRNGQRVVSGVYIYKITTPDGDYLLGKLMILR